ncbi:MAG TPA: helix-turn-helix transcriptional regulator [Polyangiaceae bacterium]
MAALDLPSLPSNSIGSLLQYWRKTRNLSQLALANEAEVSARHICFLENGRAKPSREMIVLLATVLDVPLRERNDMLLAAGFAPVYKETALDAPELLPVHEALKAILRKQEPFPAVVMNRRWDVLEANAAAQRFFGFLLGESAGAAPSNVLHMMFDPRAVRPYVTNWEEVAESLLRRVQREAVAGVKDAAIEKLLSSLLSYPGVPRRWSKPSLEVALVPVIPVRFCKDDNVFNFFSAITTLGTPQDITLQEVRIECFFPADEGTERTARELLQSGRH